MHLIAALTFFTRLPFWRIAAPKKEHYASVVEYWPMVGWFTSLCMAGTIYATSYILPWHLAVLSGIAVRVLITGALHEDGLADFADGFGAGGDRERTLAIMKDSHIGTFGVLALIAYFATLWSILVSLSPLEAALLILAGDPYAKMISAQIIQLLPYARTEQQAKSHILYRTMSTRAALLLFLQGILPMTFVLLAIQQQLLPVSSLNSLIGGNIIQSPTLCLFLPGITMYALYRLMLSRIQGYTGDCCGALFLLTELTFYLAYIIA